MSPKKGLLFIQKPWQKYSTALKPQRHHCFLLCCSHREGEPSSVPFVHNKALRHKSTVRPAGIYWPREASGSVCWVLARAVAVWSFPKPRYAPAPNTTARTVQIYFACISPLKGIVKDYLCIQKMHEKLFFCSDSSVCRACRGGR